MKLRTTLYFALAFVGLVGTWGYNIVAILDGRNFIDEWLKNGPAVSSLSIDLLVASVAALIFMIVETRRLRMKGPWTIVCFVSFFCVAFAFAFPLFLAVRERTIQHRATLPSDPASQKAASEPGTQQPRSQE